jgi:hypothetical protein
MLLYDLWYEDEERDGHGYNGGSKDRAGGEVFDQLYFRAPFPGDEVGQSFNTGVDDLCDPNQASHYGEDGSFGVRYVQKEAGDDHGKSRRHMDAGIVLPADKLPQAREGVRETFYPRANREFFGLHDRNLG